jgi:hypothetical protein
MGFTRASTVAVTGSLLLISSALSQNSATDDWKGRVREAVLEAKASRRSQIEIVPPQITPPSVDNLFTIGERYSVIVVQPLQIATSVTTDGSVIMSWYKLKISDVLTKQPTVPSKPLIEQFGPPAILLPLGADEVLVGVDGGSIVSEGVTVLQHSPFDFRLQLNRQYVLTVYLEASGAIATLASMSDGAFELQPDGSIRPLGHKDHPLVKDIYVRTGNRLEFLREALKEQRRAANPDK